MQDQLQLFPSPSPCRCHLRGRCSCRSSQLRNRPIGLTLGETVILRDSCCTPQSSQTRCPELLSSPPASPLLCSCTPAAYVQFHPAQQKVSCCQQFFQGPPGCNGQDA